MINGKGHADEFEGPGRITSRSPTFCIVERSKRRRSRGFCCETVLTRRPPLVTSTSSVAPGMSFRARISGGVASCSRPSRAANSATPISMHDVTPVRKVPASQRAETSRRSGGRRRPPTLSGARHPDRDCSAPCLSYCCSRSFFIIDSTNVLEIVCRRSGEPPIRYQGVFHSVGRLPNGHVSFACRRNVSQRQACPTTISTIPARRVDCPFRKSGRSYSGNKAGLRPSQVLEGQ